jgi:hypothetical protein
MFMVDEWATRHSEPPVSDVLLLSDQLRQECRDDQDDNTAEQDDDGLLRASFPFFEDNSPNVGERYIERHEDAEC